MWAAGGGRVHQHMQMHVSCRLHVHVVFESVTGSMQAKRLQAEVASVSNRSRSQGSVPASAGQQRSTQEQQSQRQLPPGARLAAAAAQEQALDADPASPPDMADAAERLTKRKREGE